MTSRKRAPIQLSRELAADLIAATSKVNEIVETLEVQLDKGTVRRLKIGEKEYHKGQYKIARTDSEIDKVLSG